MVLLEQSQLRSMICRQCNQLEVGLMEAPARQLQLRVRIPPFPCDFTLIPCRHSELVSKREAISSRTPKRRNHLFQPVRHNQDKIMCSKACIPPLPNTHLNHMVIEFRFPCHLRPTKSLGTRYRAIPLNPVAGCESQYINRSQT